MLETVVKIGEGAWDLGVSAIRLTFGISCIGIMLIVGACVCSAVVDYIFKGNKDK